jgi:hypothetical protein
MIWRFLLILIAVASTVFFINYKYTKGIRIIAFGEEETTKEAKFQFFMMGVIIAAWTTYLLLF